MATKKKDLFELGLLSDEPDYRGFVGTGSYALNKVISGDYNGGVPIGAITEFYGESSTAKTVFITAILANAQKNGYHAKLLDTERSYGAEFASNQGLDPNKLYYSMPETLEDVFEDIEKTIETIREKDSETPIVIGVDSIAVAPIRKELEEDEYGQSETMGMIRAKIIGGCLRRINPLLKKESVCLVIVNQLRSKMSMYGSPDTKAAGGRSLQFYCAVCLETMKGIKTAQGVQDKIKNDHKQVVGIWGRIKNTKNKVAHPFRETEFELLFDKGLTPDFGLVDQLCADGIIDDKTSQGWCILGEHKFRRKEFLELFKAGKFPEISDLLNITDS